MWPRWDCGHQLGTVPLCRTVSPWDSPWISFLHPFLLAEEPPHPAAFLRGCLQGTSSGGTLSLMDDVILLNNAFTGPCNEPAPHSGVHPAFTYCMGTWLRYKVQAASAILRGVLWDKHHFLSNKHVLPPTGTVWLTPLVPEVHHIYGTPAQQGFLRS